MYETREPGKTIDLLQIIKHQVVSLRPRYGRNRSHTLYIGDDAIITQVAIQPNTCTMLSRPRMRVFHVDLLEKQEHVILSCLYIC